jgi:hypothetical protein
MYVGNFIPEFSVTGFGLHQISVAEFSNTFCHSEYSLRPKRFLIEALLSLLLSLVPGKFDLLKQVLNGNISENLKPYLELFSGVYQEPFTKRPEFKYLMLLSFK